MTVPLPATGDGSRRQRREDRKRRGRRSAVRIAVIAAAVVVVGALGWYVATLVGDDGDDPSNQVVAPPAHSDGPASLVLLTDEAGDLYAVTMLVPATSTIVHVPPGTLVEVPSLGLASLIEAERAGGDELVRQSLENVLGVPVVAGALGEVGSLTVTLDEPVESRAADGRVSVLFAAGEVIVDASNVEAFLGELGNGTMLDRIVRHQSFWSARVDAGEVDALEGEVRQRVLPVQAIADVDELYQVDGDQLGAFVARVFPGAPRPDGGRIRVRVLNGAGAPGVAQQVQPLLIDIGAELILSGNADRFDYETTQVVFYDDDHAEDARAVASALGVGEIVRSRTELAVVDVTVVVGADFLAAHPGG
jgi:hypothetical protein